MIYGPAVPSVDTRNGLSVVMSVMFIPLEIGVWRYCRPRSPHNWSTTPHLAILPNSRAAANRMRQPIVFQPFTFRPANSWSCQIVLKVLRHSSITVY